MPLQPRRPCRVPGCAYLVGPGAPCPVHGQAKAAAGRFADARRGSRHQRGYGSEWDKLRPLILARDGGLCQVCIAAGVITPGCNIVDHIKAKAEGGTDDPANLRCICAPCHKAKTSREAAAGRGALPAAGDQAEPVRVGRLRLL